MKTFKHFAQRYVDWVIRLGRVRFSLLGVIILAILALCTQVLVSLFIIHQISWMDIFRSVTFGLLTAPFVIYFFTLLVERLERSRQDLAYSVATLKKEASEREIAQQKLSYALKKLEKNSKDKSTLLATISHELRTPLNGIVGLSQILLDENLDERQRNYLKTINISALTLGYIFSDIIDLEKIDSRRIELNIKATDTHLFLNDIYNFAAFMAKQKNLQFHLQIEDDLPNYLYLDTIRLSQILWNLISNAVKFTEKGSITLKVTRKNEQCHFYVIDTGIGIAPEEQSSIFDLYYQVKESKLQSAGSGIGLSISKNLAQLMHGNLSVESQLGKGSTFHLNIYAETVEKEEEKTNLSSLNLQPLNILLIEDVELNILVARTILEKQGHHVDAAINGKEGITLFERNIYDLILLDIKLPDMTGFDIAQYLRENYEEGIYDFLPPIIAFTANVMQSEKEYLAMGMDGVLRKPISINELNHCLQHFFELDESTKNEENTINSDFEFNYELIDSLGKDNCLNYLSLFEQSMPDYLDLLLTAVESTHIKNIAEIAHKIKGASSSIGLQSIHKIAAQLENVSQHNNTLEIENLYAELKSSWLPELTALKSYLINKEEHSTKREN